MKVKTKVKEGQSQIVWKNLKVKEGQSIKPLKKWENVNTLLKVSQGMFNMSEIPSLLIRYVSVGYPGGFVSPPEGGGSAFFAKKSEIIILYIILLYIIIKIQFFFLFILLL